MKRTWWRTGGLELEWSNAVALRELLRLMACREGIGGIFADGTRNASQKIGKGSEEFAINIFGMELQVLIQRIH